VARKKNNKIGGLIPDDVVVAIPRDDGLVDLHLYCEGCKQLHVIPIRLPGTILRYNGEHEEYWSLIGDEKCWGLDPCIHMDNGRAGHNRECNFYIQANEANEAAIIYDNTYHGYDGQSRPLLPVALWPEHLSKMALKLKENAEKK
jgi:hypothetical protein